MLDELDLKSLSEKLSIEKTDKFKLLVPATPIIVNTPPPGPIVPANTNDYIVITPPATPQTSWH